jgi:dipeptidyl-peptidase-4
MKRETQRTIGHRVTETQRDRFYQRVRISVTLCLCGLVCSVALFTSVPRVFAQRKPLTLDDIYGPTTRVNFGGAPAPAFAWIDSGHYAWPRVIAGDRRSVEWLRVDAATGATEPLFDATKAEAAIAALPGVVAADAKSLARSRDLIFNPNYSAAIVTIADDLYLYTIANNRIVRLTSTAGEKEEPTFSPDGSNVAFVHNNNLAVVDAATGREVALTADGTGRILNGKMDWVYEEEIYGRGEKRAYWWSPDSSRLAFLRIDDTRVSTYVTLDDTSYDPRVETWQYPRAGDPNPTVKLGVVRAAGGPGEIDWIDLSKYADTDFLVVRVAWTPAGRLAFEVENRTQSWLDVNTVDVNPATSSTAVPKTLLHETSPFWINSEDTTTPTWLQDGSFLWLSARSGFTHAYHYSADGALLKQVTTGRWELRTLHGVDEKSGWIYFAGTERSPIGSDVYRTKIDGSGFERLSRTAGTHRAEFSPGFAYFIDSWSDVSTPVQVRLYRNDGRDVRTLHENKVAAFEQYRLATPEFVQVKTRDGFVMEAMMIKPPDFDPSKRYPVYQFTYGGPHSQEVRNAWTLQNMYHQLLAQHGVIVWICDNRTASGKGLESTWPVFRHFGEVELRDVEDGLTWLKQQPYVDASRIGIHGWSYGGFMTAYALTHSTSFVMGIAGGTVSDWRNYDTVYTERYMGTPQDNPDGYRNSSPRFAAANLHGALLLMHGAIDDNVHLGNTMQFAYELQQAGKPFSLMLYPKSRHGVTDPALVRHMRGMMLDFILEHLKPNDPTGTR